MTSDEFDKAIINGAMQLMLENEKKFFTLLDAEDKILAKEFDGELWIKASDHYDDVNRSVAAEREACAKLCEKHKYVNAAKGLADVIRARGQK